MALNAVIIMHCFCGNLEATEKANKYGYYLHGLELSENEKYIIKFKEALKKEKDTKLMVILKILPYQKAKQMN